MVLDTDTHSSSYIKQQILSARGVGGNTSTNSTATGPPPTTTVGTLTTPYRTPPRGMPRKDMESSDIIVDVEEEDLPVHHEHARNANGQHREPLEAPLGAGSDHPSPNSRFRRNSFMSSGHPPSFPQQEVLFLPLYLVCCVVLGVLLGATGVALGIYNTVSDDEATTGTSAELGSGNGADADGSLLKSTLETVHERGYVNCGTGPEGAPGFLVNPSGGTPPLYVGLEVDLCLALTAALFNGDVVDKETGERRYRILPQDPAGQWRALGVNHTIDVLFRTTPTMERDVFEPSTQLGFEFSTPYYWDGLVLGGLPDFLACAEQLDFTSVTGVNCAETSICVEQGSTHESVLKGLLPATATLVPYSTGGLSFPERCNVLAGVEAALNPQAMQARGYVGPYAMGTRFLSLDPLAIATRQNDPHWTDFVEWTLVQALVYAEEEQITKGAAALRFEKTALFAIQNDTTVLERAFKDSVGERGNYGEMYNFNLQSVLPRSRLNSLNPGNSPLLYSMPFGNVEDLADELAPPELEVISPTVAAIKARGFLSCGINSRAGFAEFNVTTRTWSGLDVDWCRALAAALFDGVDNRIVFVDLPAAQRFPVLADGRVDVLSRLTTATFSRDVKEPQTGIGLSFAAPYLYDGLTFGGLPPYVECADNFNLITPACQSLQVCLLQGTTMLTLVQDLLHEQYVSAKLTFQEVIDGLNDGSCNVIAGGLHDVAVSTLQERGFTNENYQIGTKRHSKDPLALTTRQDDAAWTEFVRWVFQGLLYAEAHNITQATAMLMPRPKVFGPLRTNALYWAVNAVGNYGQVYERNLGTLVPRNGLHLLNSNTNGGGAGPMLYALPGIPTRN